ncbi:putative RNA-directed DNA polymerase [Aphis craccivora]|uniref:Putative RNA-directed DNA polymerase n=1 Tax=Aphis craccivora TaxID=307492 RepID=A0A6G0W0Z5_APHCR|nr:putative RNA-directed DNA polymerase [Aphis craccivora]
MIYIYIVALSNFKISDSISISLSIFSGKYPSSYEKTIIIPMFKSGDRKQCGNYRAFSVNGLKDI